MNFDLTEEQKILKKTARDFLEKECPRELARKLMESDEGYSPELWRKIAELGWTGLIFPEEFEGSECTFLDLMILMEEMGYNLCPWPFLSTVLLGSLPIVSFGDARQKKEFLPKIARGDLILTMALTEESASYEASAIRVPAKIDGNDYVISGLKLFVPDAHIADFILCAARTGGVQDPEQGVTVFIVDAKNPAVKCTLLKTLSQEKQCEVEFDDVRVSKENILGELDRGWPIVKDTLGKATLAKCLEMVGGAQAAMDMAMQYAKERIQFDQPIGSFQAIQHYFADMWMAINGARMLTFKAASMVSKEIPADKEVAIAKAKTGEAFRKVTALSHQIFGGIGFTMEHDLHLYHRRSITGDMTFGDTGIQREKIAGELGL